MDFSFFRVCGISANDAGTKVFRWFGESLSKHNSWPIILLIVVVLPVLLTFIGRRFWKRRLKRWADEQGLTVVSFRRAGDEKRLRMVSAFGEWDSDWLEVFEVVVETKESGRRTGLVAFKSRLGLGPYRFRDVRWIG